MLKNIFSFKTYLFFLIFFFSFIFSNANEIEIKAKINNQIITNYDISNEMNYLMALNNNLKRLPSEQIYEAAKNSIIREKVKKLEIEKIYVLNENNAAVDANILRIIQNLNLDTIEQFNEYLKKYNLTYDEVYKKIEIETLWNQLIYSTFKNRVIINENELINKIKKNTEETIQYKLSEIVFTFDDKNEIELRYNEIIKSINSIGFKDTVSVYSVADSSKNFGSLDWINENALSELIRKTLKQMNIGEISKPIILPTAAIILKIEDKRKIKDEIDISKELKKLKNFELDNQLNRYSLLYFNKIKKNIIINEF